MPVSRGRTMFCGMVFQSMRPAISCEPGARRTQGRPSTRRTATGLPPTVTADGQNFSAPGSGTHDGL